MIWPKLTSSSVSLALCTHYTVCIFETYCVVSPFCAWHMLSDSFVLYLMSLTSGSSDNHLHEALLDQLRQNSLFSGSQPLCIPVPPYRIKLVLRAELLFLKKYFFSCSWTQYLYFIYLFLCVAEDLTWGLARARRALYCRATATAPQNLFHKV
ncbi:hypothetical protein H1C71_015874 [Ictidomys tridecemlineatus]|nr:hypothetical protein H1C71_015874 [Ictidomys tridecemlineatus]